jgi:hypothetical protein
MADGSTGTTSVTAAGGAGTPFRVFTTQEEFDQYTNGIEAKGRQIAERRIKTATASEVAELEAARVALQAHEQKDLEAKGNYEKAKQTIEKTAAEQVDKAKAALAKAQAVARKHLVSERLKNLALANGAYDPEDIIARLEPRIVVDEDYQVHVSDAPGGAVQDGVTMEQAVIDLLKSKPHLAKAAGAGRGAGAAGGASLAGSFSGTPSQREAQAKYDAALARLKANPADAVALADSMRLQKELEKAKAA